MDALSPRPLAIVPFERGSKTYRTKRYSQRAEILREIAGDLVDPQCQEVLIRLANSYQVMAALEGKPMH